MSTSVDSSLLGTVVRAHRDALERLEVIVEGLSGEQANWKPAPGSWSVAQCLDHLNQSLGTYLERMVPAVRQAHSDGMVGREPYGSGTIVGRLLVGFLRQPARKIPAPAVFRPRGGDLELDEVVETFRAGASEMIEVARAADGLALGEIRIATPISRLLRLSLAQAFEVHSLHTPRHLAQASRLLQREDFPVR